MHDDAPRSQPNWRRRFTIAVVVAVALVLLWFAAAAVIPRWWAQRVGNVVDGSLTVGALYGLFIGFVFTVAPLLLLLAVIRWRTSDRTWLGWLGWILLVLLLAAPEPDDARHRARRSATPPTPATARSTSKDPASASGA